MSSPGCGLMWDPVRLTSAPAGTDTPAGAANAAVPAVGSIVAWTATLTG